MAISRVAAVPSITHYILGLPTLNPDGASYKFHNVVKNSHHLNFTA